jgi:Group XII secretory phospholipase A2 precursor (PLA2G12)
VNGEPAIAFKTGADSCGTSFWPWQSRLGGISLKSLSDKDQCGKRTFEDIARLATSELPRRTVLKLIVTGFTAAVLARLGVTPALASPDNCICNGVTYNSQGPQAQCCTPSGVQNNHPITNLSACPNRGPHPEHIAGFNGCGPEGRIVTVVIPNAFGPANFYDCCKNHDICYDTCLKNKAADCDSPFFTCLTNACGQAFGLLPQLKNVCVEIATVYFGEVSGKGGDDAYNAAQQIACDCCGSGGGNQPCPNGTNGGGCCADGFHCIPGCGCCPATADKCCGAGNCCEPDHDCCPGHGCCQPGAPCCPGTPGGCAPPGGICCDGWPAGAGYTCCASTCSLDISRRLSRVKS